MCANSRADVCANSRAIECTYVSPYMCAFDVTIDDTYTEADRTTNI